MNVKEALSAYQEYSSKASEIARTLSLSGIAVIWVLRDAGSTAPFLTPALYWPGVFFVGALAADLFHYVIGTVVWGVYHRRKELSGVARDAEFKAPRLLNWPINALFILKLVLVGVGYVLLLSYLLSRLPSPQPVRVSPTGPGTAPTSAPRVSTLGLDPVAVSMFEALGVWAAVAVALFWPWVQERLARPKLSVRATSEPQSVHKTTAVSTANPGITVACYYYRLDVVNDGRSAARDVEVFARAAFKRNDKGEWEKDERFLPQWLCWATWRNVRADGRVFMPVIPPHSARYLDFGHVIEPGRRHLFDLENDPNVPTASAIFSLDVTIMYQRLGHLLAPGYYALVLEASASNAEPRPFVVTISNPGYWDLGESNMLTWGVKVEAVHSLKSWNHYGSIKGLLGTGD
jgi:hypothetical protein